MSYEMTRAEEDAEGARLCTCGHEAWQHDYNPERGACIWCDCSQFRKQPLCPECGTHVDDDNERAPFCSEACLVTALRS